MAGKFFTGISATTAPFTLPAGQYVIFGNATWGPSGDVALQLLSPDETTWLIVTAADKTSDGVSNPVYLPSGQYRFVLNNVTNLSIGISPVMLSP
jgi:hypothetical protein